MPAENEYETIENPIASDILIHTPEGIKAIAKSKKTATLTLSQSAVTLASKKSSDIVSFLTDSDPLNQTTPAQIQQAARLGIAPLLWSVGDLTSGISISETTLGTYWKNTSTYATAKIAAVPLTALTLPLSKLALGYRLCPMLQNTLTIPAELPKPQVMLPVPATNCG